MTMTVAHRYAPRGSAAVAMRARDPELLLSGPAGTGKSRALLEKLHACAIKYPGMRGLIVRKTQASLKETVFPAWEDHVIDSWVWSGQVQILGGSSTDRVYAYSNGSRIVSTGMDKATKIMSSQYDMAFVEEAIELTVDDWEAITTRLRNGQMPYQQLLGSTNPSAAVHWLKQRADSGQTKMLESRHEDNPVYVNEDGSFTEAGQRYIEGKLDKLTGVRFQRLRRGLWVGAEGQIWEDWDPAVHVIPRFEIPADWPRYWAIDWGYRDPFVLQCWAEDPDGRLYLYREIYHTGRTVRDHARQILRLVTDERGNWTEPEPWAVITDHHASDRAEFESEIGFSTKLAVKDITDGLQAVELRLRKTEEDDRPRLFVLEDSLVERDQSLGTKPKSVVEEIPGYVWGEMARPGAKEAPVDKDNHGCDAMRYMVKYKDSLPSYRV